MTMVTMGVTTHLGAGDTIAKIQKTFCLHGADIQRERETAHTCVCVCVCVCVCNLQ